MTEEIRELRPDVRVHLLRLVGAGGAARGVIAPLMDNRPQQLGIANRTMDRANELGAHFSEKGHINAMGFGELNGEKFDAVINATSASLQGDLPPLPVSAITDAQIVYDMMYGSEPTRFLQWAKQHDAKKISDGLGMLVEQAAESFYIWRNVRPETTPVIQNIRANI